MRTKHLRTAAWLAVLLLAFPGLSSAARKGRLIGKIVDPDGNPIVGVRVTTTAAEIPEMREVDTTDAKGLFKVDFPRLNIEYVYEMEKAGHVTLKISQNWTKEGTERLSFTMLPAAAPTLGELPPALAAVADPAIMAFNEGARAFQEQDYETAGAKFQEATERDPSLRPAWVALSATHLEQRRYLQAAEAAEKAIALGATDEAVLKTRWEAYRHLGDEEKAARAREDLERTGRMGEEAKRLYNEGVSLSRFKENEAAFEKYQAALELDPNFEPALLGLASSALALDRAGAAEGAALTLLKMNPANAEALKLRYNAALKLRDEAKLTEALVGLAAVDATTARDGLFLLASAAFDRDDMARAREGFALVLKLDPSHARSHYSLGLVLMRAGEKEQARAELERFLELAPNDPNATMARDALKYLK